VIIAALGLLGASCGASSAGSSSTPVGPSAAANETTAATTAATPTATVMTPATLAAAAGPPTYDPQALGDNKELGNLVVTLTVDNTNGSEFSEDITTTGFISEPASGFQLATFSYDGTTDGTSGYFIGGRTYEQNQFGDWYLYESDGRGAPDYSGGVDLRDGTLAGVATAQLIGEEDFAGIPSNHFAFNETNLVYYSSFSPENPSPTVEGDFYLARQGNYVLYTHSKESSPNRVYEVTEAVSAIGQVPPIELPADLAPMKEALDIGAALGDLLPPRTELSGMLRYSHGIGIDYYTYTTPVRNNDEMLSFYDAMSPTDGWTVTHIGHIAPHLERVNCETQVECVILQNGDEQIVVSFGGTITLEYDRQHVFRPT
jgi:hypothetical protein